MPKTQSKQEKHRKAAREKDPEYDEKRKLAEQERRKKQKLVKLEAAAAAPSAAGTPATTTPAPCCSCGCGSAPSITTSVTGPSKADAAAAAALSQLAAVSQLDKASEGSEASDDDEHRPIWSMSEYKEYGERCRQYGREAAADKHTFQDEKVVRVLQRQLMNAAHTIEELAETLEEERLQHKQLNPAAHHVDRAQSQRERLELVRDAAESFETVAFESLEELRARCVHLPQRLCGMREI